MKPTRKDNFFVLEESKLLEKFDKIFQFKNLSVFDARHAVEEFERHYNLPYDSFLKVLEKGLKKIEKKFGLNEADNYMIQSYRLGIRIPLEIRFDNKNPNEMIGVVPTVLAPHEIKNLRNEIEVMVENNKNTFRKFEVCNGFNYFIQSGKVYSDFEKIIIKE